MAAAKPEVVKPIPVDSTPDNEHRIYFQIPLNHSRELAPGISVGVTAIDMDSRTASGWMADARQKDDLA